ncbi:hypothetical protein K458DRAFT_405550 [Lentithecium fluviatile CBS 122367]|uniref:C2H2-type domain-containing protein n=1 Tax=Lentithecium fluviatile CBS 122367 TaxID=1168545 RepID=A0A6G1IXX1_9PLEO|nr:hypothetical protein K458DRAFT_405550 [Lentithecium fluviatile CBS 122367]
MGDMYSEEDSDPFYPAPGWEKRRSDVVRTPTTNPYAHPYTPWTPAVVDPRRLPPSVQKAWVASCNGTPMADAVAYVQDPFSTHLFPVSPANAYPLRDRANVTPPSNTPPSMTVNYFNGSMATTAPSPPAAPATPPKHQGHSALSFAQRSADNFDSWEASFPSQYTPQSIAGSPPSPPPPPPPPPAQSPNICSECGRSFSGEYAPGNLKRHLRSSHSNIKSICEADGCGREFKRSDARREHYKKCHQELL